MRCRIGYRTPVRTPARLDRSYPHWLSPRPSASASETCTSACVNRIARTLYRPSGPVWARIAGGRSPCVAGSGWSGSGHRQLVVGVVLDSREELGAAAEPAAEIVEPRPCTPPTEQPAFEGPEPVVRGGPTCPNGPTRRVGPPAQTGRGRPGTEERRTRSKHAMGLPA